MQKFMTVLGAMALTVTAQAQEWGNLKGKIVLDGDVPKPVLQHAEGANVKDGTVCAAQDTYKQDLIIDKESKGIANVFIYLYRAPKAINPDLVKKDARVIFDQEKCVFKPHALVLQAGQTVEVLNSDPIAHNTHTYPIANQQQNILIAPNTKEGDGVDIESAVREILPHKVACDFHTFMTAYWLILDHPYAAVTDAEGNFEIKGLPIGDHDFRIWHERAGYIDRKFGVTVTADGTEIEPYKIPLSKLEEE